MSSFNSISRLPMTSSSSYTVIWHFSMVSGTLKVRISFGQVGGVYLVSLLLIVDNTSSPITACTQTFILPMLVFLLMEATSNLKLRVLACSSVNSAMMLTKPAIFLSQLRKHLNSSLGFLKLTIGSKSTMPKPISLSDPTFLWSIMVISRFLPCTLQQLLMQKVKLSMKAGSLSPFNAVFVLFSWFESFTKTYGSILKTLTS